MNELWIAIVVAVVAPALMQLLKNNQDNRSKKQDWARQDKVAALLLETSGTTQGKLDIIHGLVNSTLTAAIQAELNATRRELALIRENVELRAEAGNETSQPVARESIKMTEARITELETTLRERARIAYDH